MTLELILAILSVSISLTILIGFILSTSNIKDVKDEPMLGTCNRCKKYTQIYTTYTPVGNDIDIDFICKDCLNKQ